MPSKKTKSENCITDSDVKALCDLSEYYRDEFIPAYADAVVYLSAKPDETLLEIENILSHVFQILNPEFDASKKAENIGKAKGHLERATLDCLKIIWGDIGELLRDINGDDNLRKFGVNMSETEFKEKVVEYHNLLSEARLVEMRSIGKSHGDTIIAYKRAIGLAKELLDVIDQGKINSFRSFRKVINIKSNTLSFILGVLASLIATYIWIDVLKF
ncbi:MAG: hypothetical protein NTY37_02870 [Methanothrix sp.]|nr:hypothetical protein [Methanothrix sp.]